MKSLYDYIKECDAASAIDAANSIHTGPLDVIGMGEPMLPDEKHDGSEPLPTSKSKPKKKKKNKKLNIQ